MKIIEQQFITASAVRALCIARGWYRHGTPEDMTRLYGMVDALSRERIITAEHLLPIARDIAAHSDNTHDLTNVMYQLARLIVRCFDYDTRGGAHDDGQ